MYESPEKHDFLIFDAQTHLYTKGLERPFIRAAPQFGLTLPADLLEMGLSCDFTVPQRDHDLDLGS